jgi:hypothetical protein
MVLATTPVIDTSAYIFEYLFKCRIPNLQTMSEEYIRFFGMPTTGDASIDQAMADQWITTMLPISKMVEYSKQGITIKIVKYDDVKVMYNYITLHLQAWKNQIGNGINVGDAPIDDLIDLDAFANLVYDQAKFQFTRDIADSLLERQMSTITRFNKSNFFKPDIKINDTGDNITRINSEPIDNYPKRESLSDIFKDRKIGYKKWN